MARNARRHRYIAPNNVCPITIFALVKLSVAEMRTQSKSKSNSKRYGGIQKFRDYSMRCVGFVCGLIKYANPWKWPDHTIPTDPPEPNYVNPVALSIPLSFQRHCSCLFLAPKPGNGTSLFSTVCMFCVFSLTGPWVMIQPFRVHHQKDLSMDVNSIQFNSIQLVMP